MKYGVNMNYFKVLTILSLLFIFCGSVYGACDADSLDISGVKIDEGSAISDTTAVENVNGPSGLTTSNNGEEVIEDASVDDMGDSKNDPTSIPDISLKDENNKDMSSTNPADVFINESFNFQMIFNNLGDATGFQPYIQLITPNELTQFTASYSDRNIVPIKVGVFDKSTYNPKTGLYTLIDPFTNKEVHGSLNSTFYILQYPLGSFTVDAPSAILDITTSIGALEIGKLLNFTVTPVFRYGNSPLDDPVNYPPIYGKTVTGWVNPVVVKIDKDSNLHEDETATGSNFPFEYNININIANGAKIENITITDVLPSTIMYLGSPVLYDSKGRIIDPSLYTIEEPDGKKTGGKIILKLKKAIGDLNSVSLSLKYKAYAPEFDNSTSNNITIIDSETGIGTTATNTARIDYTYANNTYDASDSYNVFLKSLATQKYAEILNTDAFSVVPYNLITYTIDFEISDYFAFDNLVIKDKFDTHKVGSAQKFLTDNKPVLSIYGKTYELNEDYYSIVSLENVDKSVTFYISKFLKDNNIGTSLIGGYYTNRSVNEGAMVGSLKFVTKVIIRYSNGSSVVSNDLVINTIETSATLLNTANKVSDNSRTDLIVPSVSLRKDIIAVDGEVINSADFYKVYPGQNITFVLDIHFPTGSVNDFIVTDFLPIPLFNINGFNPVNSTTGILPKVGYWSYANNSGFLYHEKTGKVIIPKINVDTANNAISFDFGDTLDNLANPVDIRLWFTVQVSSEPMADQLNLVNLAEMKFKDSVEEVYVGSNIVLMLTNEPELKITKNVNDTKILENIENATDVKYNITITNIGHSDAYNILVADDFVNSTTSGRITKADVKSVSLVYSNGTVVDITDFKDELFTKGYMIAQLAKNTSCSIVYTARFNEYLIPKESIINNVWITNFAAFPKGTNFVTNREKYRDNATIMAKGLEITKEFIGSNVTDNKNVLFVGEIGIYEITVNLPDLRVPNLVIKDNSYGIKYTNFTITTSDGLVVPEYEYAVTYTPSTTHPERSYLTINFNGDIVPAYAKNNQLIIKAYYAVVNNEDIIPATATSATTSNHASISWTDNTVTSNTVNVDVYQPKIDINKIFEPNTVQGGDGSSFTITINNNGKGTAYNTTITDDLTEFIKTFVNSRNDIEATVLEGNESGKIIFNWNKDVARFNVGELLAGKRVIVKFTFNVKNDVVIGKEFKNMAKVEYYSIFNETKFDEKRNYSNQATSTLYTYDAKVNKTVFNTTIANGKDKVTIGENVTYNITAILPVGKYNTLEVKDILPEGFKYNGGTIAVYKGNSHNKAIEGGDYTVTVNENIIKLTFTSEFAYEIIKEYGGKFQVFLNATVLNVNNNKAGAVKTNKASLTWNGHESVSDASVTVVEPKVDITKKFNVETVVGGDEIYFDITITNNGKSPLFNITISDDLSDLINKFVNGSIDVTSNEIIVTPTWNNNTASINIAELDMGKSLTYRFTFKIREDVVIGSTYINVANVIGYSALSEGRNYTNAARDSFTTELPAVAKWVIDTSIGHNKDYVTIGENITYGINVTLPTGNYTKLVIKDTLPQGFEYIVGSAFYANGTKLVNGSDWTINVTNNIITITISNVHSSDFADGILSINLTARATIFDQTNIAGAIKVNNADLFLNDKNIDKSSAKVIIVEPTTDITKKFNVTEVEGQDHVSFDVVVKNNGKSSLFNVTIIDELDGLDLFIGQIPSADNVDIKVTDANGEPVDAKIKWIWPHVEIDVAKINPGNAIHVKYSFIVRSDIQIGSQYVNTAEVVGFSAPDHGRNYYNYSEDTLKTKMPTITKLVIETTLDNNDGDKFTPTIGENVTYQITVVLPKGNYTNLQVKDILPTGFEYLEDSVILSNGTVISGVEVDGNILTINFGNTSSLKHPNNIIFNLSAVVLNDSSNKAQAFKNNHAELYLNNTKVGSADADVKIVEPEIKISKTSDKTIYEYYENATYTITIRNIGSGAAYSISIRDVLPSGLKYTGINSSSKSEGWVVEFDEESGNFIIDGLNLTAGDEFTFKFVVSFVNYTQGGIIESPIGKSFKNTANIVYYSINESNNRTYSDSASTSIRVTEAELSVSKTTEIEAIAGNDIVYTIIVANNGLDKAQNVKLNEYYYSDYLTNLEYSFDGEIWNVYNNPIDLGSINSGESKTVYIRGHLDAGAADGEILNNTVRVNTTTGELDLSDNEATNIKNVIALTELYVAKINTTSAIAGSNIMYEVVITNNGPSYAREVFLKDEFNATELTDMKYSFDGQVWHDYNEAINIGLLTDGESKTIYFRGVIPADKRGNILNNAVINSTTKLTENSKLEDDVTVEVKYDTTLVVVKDAETKELNPGDTAHFIITVTAGGLSDSLEVYLRDILDNKLLDINSAKYSINGGNLNDFNGNVYLGKISTGTSVVVDIWVKVLSTADKDIFNLASVTSDEHPEGIESHTIIHVRIVDLSVSKDSNNANPKYLENIEYTITVTNDGPDMSFNVTVRDLLPVGVKFISTDGEYDYDTGVWFIGDLNSKESATLKIIAQIIDVGKITNNVNVTGTGHDTNLTNNNDSATVNVQECVILDVAKIANSNEIVAGESVAYSVTVTNKGPSLAKDVVLKDIYNPKDLIGLQYSLNGNDWLDYTGAINLGDIGANDYMTLYFKSKVNASARGDVLNTVNIATSVEDARGKFSDDETVNVIADTTLTVVKYAEIKELNPGDTAHFIITVTAEGSSDSLNVNLKDILNNELLDVNEAHYSINGVDNGMWTGSFDLGNMPTGTTLTVDIWVKVLSTADKDIFNLANVTSDEHPEGSTSSTTIHVRIVDLSVEKTSNNTNPKYLENIEYTITVINKGPDMSFNVAVRDLLPDGVKFIRTDGNYDPVTGAWFIGDLNSQESATLKITVQVIKIGNITNNVNVTGTGHDNNSTNNNDSATVTVPESVLMNIAKVANQTVIVAGENVGYTVVVTNYGPSDASDVILKDIFNTKELLNVKYSLNGEDWFDYSEAINLGTINSGTDMTVHFKAKVNGSARGDILNTVTITTSVDDARGNFSDDETVNAIADTTLIVVKDAEIKALNPGDTAHFIITVTAGGSSDSLNVKLEDILDANLLDVDSATYRINGGDLTNYAQIISLGNMLTGNQAIVDIYAPILNTTGQDIFNSVTVASDEHPEGNTSNTSIHVNIADIEIIKTVNNTSPNYGDKITYTITVRNNGPDNSTNIRVSEVLADNLKFISADASKGHYDLTNSIWAVGNLTNNETARLVITVKIVKTGFIQNNVSVNGTGYDPNLTNNNATVNITVPQTADLSVVKIVNVKTVTVGDKIIYTIIVKNNGPDTALGVYAVDKLSDALKFVSYKSSVGTYNPTTGIWKIGNLTNGSTATLEITSIVLKTGAISNEVFVNGSTVDLNMSNNYNNISITVNPIPSPVPDPAGQGTPGAETMPKAGNPIFALLVVLVFAIFGFGVSRNRK